MSTKRTQQIVNLKGDALKWLRARIPDYQSSDTAHGSKTQTARGIADQFIDHFQLGDGALVEGTTTPNPLAGITLNNSPATLGTIRQKIARWFLNHSKSELKNTTSRVAPALVTFPGLPRKANGKSMFAEAHGDLVKLRMNDAIRTMNLPTQHNLKYWGEAVDGLWNALTTPEREEWHTWAIAHNARANEPPSPSEIFANQELLHPTLQAVFDGLIGHGANQIGDAVFHLQFAFRGPGRVVKTFSLSSQPAGGTPLSGSTEQYAEQITRPFIEWVQASLTVSVVSTKPITISLDGNGRPILPKIDMANSSNAEFAKILENYLEHVWRFNHQSSDGRHPIPWDQLAGAPTDYIEAARIPSPIVIKRPRDMLGAHVQLLYLHILASQQPNSPLTAQTRFEFLPPPADAEELLEELSESPAMASEVHPPPSAMRAPGLGTAPSTPPSVRQPSPSHGDDGSGASADAMPADMAAQCRSRERKDTPPTDPGPTADLSTIQDLDRSDNDRPAVAKARHVRAPEGPTRRSKRHLEDVPDAPTDARTTKRPRTRLSDTTQDQRSGAVSFRSATGAAPGKRGTKGGASSEPLKKKKSVAGVRSGWRPGVGRAVKP